MILKRSLKGATHIAMDKFYTVPTVAATCLQTVAEHFGGWHPWDLVVEPSAGNGSFYTQLPPGVPNIGIDIAPEHPDVQARDFLTFVPPESASRVLVVGNPPFGRVSSMAVRFFNHAAGFAQVIAFIVPRTFRRHSVHAKLHPNFHLVHDNDIAMHPCAFMPKMMAKCCFQIWQKQEVPRVVLRLALTHPDWTFMDYGPKDASGQPTPPDAADFALRAYGAHCGRMQREHLALLRPKSWHWLRATGGGVPVEELMSRFQQLDYSVSRDTARQDSIGRGELVALYSARFQRPSL